MPGLLHVSLLREPESAPMVLSWNSLRRWNVSRHAGTFRAADAFVVSVPKSGRTWARVFLLAYFAECERLNPGFRAPRCVYTHDRWEHETKGRFVDRLRGKWLIPRADAAAKPVLLVARDPRDVIVSLFFHLQKRAHSYDGDLSGLLRHPTFGVRRVVAVMNGWLAEWNRPGSLHLLRYEDAKLDPHRSFAEALRFLQPDLEPDPRALAHAVEVSSFENMRRLEKGDAQAAGSTVVATLQEEALRPADANDVDSYKVRRGKVGGYVDYLSAEDMAFLDEEVARLDERFGYAAAGVRA